MAIKFNQFTTGDPSNTGPSDYLVGYDSTQDGVPGGERKWAISTIANAVSSLIPSSPYPTGGGNDKIFLENSQNITTNYTITNGKNAMTAGPVTIDAGVSVTVPSGSVWTVI